MIVEEYDDGDYQNMDADNLFFNDNKALKEDMLQTEVFEKDQDHFE